MAAENVEYRFIQNVGDYFPAGYFSVDFIDKVQKASGLSSDAMLALCPPYKQLKGEYEKYKNYILNTNPRVKDAIKHTHDFHTRLLRLLGYSVEQPYAQFYAVNDSEDSVVPVRHVLTRSGQTSMLIMEMQHLIKTSEHEPAGLFDQHYDDPMSGKGGYQTVKNQQYYSGRWSEVFTLDEGLHLSPAVINKAIDALFLLPEERRPHYILMMAGNVLFLLDQTKWSQGAYLQFSLDELFSQASIPAFKKYYALFHLLLAKETLAADSESLLMETLVEDSYKNAYEVTKDLKEGVVKAVETLANEALYYKKYVVNEPFGKYDAATQTYDETNDDFEAEVKDDCLTIVYRLLFIFYAESRTELEILPTGDSVYKQGYSLEILRDLEQVNLRSKESQDGYFFDETIQHLFRLLSAGHASTDTANKSFYIRPIDSPLFNNQYLKHLGDVKIRNSKWQEIICALSLSKKNGRFGRGRISYANLGVNQLGSVYESLLAFRGFYAEEDYIEVHKAGRPDEGSFLVPYSRMDDFAPAEIRCGDDERPLILPKGSFVYRLNGRDRQKSASYYTPEVLTRSTVKYTLKSVLDDVRANRRAATELLELKILEPAMGAAAFQNEVINQLAEAYLTEQQRQQREHGLRNWRIQPDRYRDELQKVKAYIATHNVYGVDLNPTAIELGKLSLWLNVIHKDMETPFFANRLAVGNAVIGAWLKVYNRQDVVGLRSGASAKYKPNKWWEKAPHKVKFFTTRVNRSVNEVYHFLLPDANMLGVRSIKEQKKAHADQDKGMAGRLKDWIAPINDADFCTLQRLSAKIDVLLKEYFTNQLSIDKYTNNRKQVWDGIEHSDAQRFEWYQTDTYERKQELFDTRYRHDNAYRKLKLAMDYWCALWFWEYDDAAALPTREEYWADIEALLDVDNEQLDSRTRKALARAGANSVEEDEGEYGRMTEEESQIVVKTQAELLTSTHGQRTLYADEDPLRLQIADRLAKRYRFFHPMLEFIEVFWLRDGFDIICGNPPWLKLEFKEQGILSEKYPEVAIRQVSAPEARKMRDQMFEQLPATEELYRSEEMEIACSAIFMNAYCNYPLLVGQQTNLYKCVLENGFTLMSETGIMGLLHPETVYDDPKGQPLRKEIYHRLRFHFQYRNEYQLFAEIGHTRKYGCHIYGGYKHDIDFYSMNNLFHPSTIDLSLTHGGEGICYGIKHNGVWNCAPHSKRVVHITSKELSLLSKMFEDDIEADVVVLTSIHDSDIIAVLDKLSHIDSLKLYPKIISEGLHDTNALDLGFMERNIQYPDCNNYGMIYSGPHIYVSTSLYQNPHTVVKSHADYDIISLPITPKTPCQRSLFKPLLNQSDYLSIFKGFGDTDSLLDYYKVGFRKMLDPGMERTMIGAILPKKAAHIGGIISVTFENAVNLLVFSALSSSLIYDFLMKTIGASNLYENRLDSFPLGISDQYKPALFARTLLLNCLTTAYADLWQEMWQPAYQQETWSLDDPRLKPFAQLHEDWAWDIPLRNYYERRMALVEIDVIAAMALGLTLEDLEMIYTIQFPVLQQNEADTWYDQKGNIVFTCSKGLTGVGLDRKRNAKTGMPGWEDIRGEQLDELTYAGTAPTHTHTIDPQKSELYGGQEVTYYAPYTKCDRIADYRRAWAHFSTVFGS